ncbi:hypothetical protein PSAB6_630024 [Paraburkholderia sabiae]|nr:hypothetical protein PSAB6_630024 [Paraburkholderia sabiae]
MANCARIQCAYRISCMDLCLALPNEPAKCACAQQRTGRAYHQMLSRVTERYDTLYDAKLCISYYKVEIRVKRCFVIFESSSR